MACVNEDIVIALRHKAKKLIPTIPKQKNGKCVLSSTLLSVLEEGSHCFIRGGSDERKMLQAGVGFLKCRVTTNLTKPYRTLQPYQKTFFYEKPYRPLQLKFFL